MQFDSNLISLLFNQTLKMKVNDFIIICIQGIIILFLSCEVGKGGEG